MVYTINFDGMEIGILKIDGMELRSEKLMVCIFRDYGIYEIGIKRAFLALEITFSEGFAITKCEIFRLRRQIICYRKEALCILAKIFKN